MDATFEFSLQWTKYGICHYLAADGHNIPSALFVNIMTEKANSSINT